MCLFARILICFGSQGPGAPVQLAFLLIGGIRLQTCFGNTAWSMVRESWQILQISRYPHSEVELPMPSMI